MEPMALGSPSHDSPQKPSYLPGFLMGERVQSPISNISISTTSPLCTNRNHTTDAHTTFLMRNFHHELSDKPSSTPILNRVNEESTKAPTIDLFDMLNTSDYREEKCNNKENKQFYTEKNNSFESPNATSGYWITVFGFSVSNKDEILSKFIHMVSYCDIREAGPNWAHICFSDPTDYHRALLFNGHVTNNGSMIGVIPCNDKTVSNENINSMNSRPGPSTEVLTKSIRSPILGQQLSSPNDSISKRHTIRPMAIKPIPIQGKETSPSATTSNGIVTKTLEYLFGWYFSLNMDIDILQEIREIVHGLGERRQRRDTMAAIQSVLFKQMALIIFQAHTIANRQNKKEILIEDVIFVLKNHKNTLKRMLKYFLFKENIHKLTAAASHIEDQEQTQNENKVKKTKLSNNPEHHLDVIQTSTDLHFPKTTDLELFSTLAENYVFKLNDCTKKKSTYNNIRKAIITLKLDLTTEEYFQNVNERRQIRINELAIQLSPVTYIGFEVCRSRVFHNKTGELLLNKVHKALPVNVYYQHQVKDIFQYLAKETIACLIDQVYENRKQFMIAKSSRFFNPMNENDYNSEKKIREAITVNEIDIIVAKIWNYSLEDIHIPFRKNDMFLNNKLIFDLYV